MADADGKTEEPTAKRLEDARNKGHIPKSQDLIQISTFIGISVIIFSQTPNIASSFMNNLKLYFHLLGENRAFTNEYVHEILFDSIQSIVQMTWPIFFAAIIVSMVAHIAQYGITFNVASAIPSFENLAKYFDIASNIQRLFFSKKAFVALLMGVLKTGIVITLGYFTLQDEIPKIILLAQADPLNVGPLLLRICMRLSVSVAIWLFFLGYLDWVWQKYSYHESLKMSKQEVNDEHRQRDGDPKVKAKLRSKMQEFSRNRMLAAVKDADAVVANPTHFAVAIRYNSQESGAPKVIARGRGFIAQKIKAEAKKHNVPIITDKPLARVLYHTVKLGSEIPKTLYKAVAQILAYVYKRKKKKIF